MRKRVGPLKKGMLPGPAVLAALVSVMLSTLMPSKGFAAPLCLSQSAVPFEVVTKLELPDPVIDRSLSTEQLTARSGKGPGLSVHGLHSHTTRVTYAIRPDAVPLDGGFCFWIERVTVTLIYLTPTIYVDSKYRPGGCNDLAILQHETEHARVATRTMAYFKPRLSAAVALGGLPQPSAPVWTQDARAEAEALLEKVGDLLEPELSDMRRVMDQRQQRVDSANNYRLIRQRCPEW